MFASRECDSRHRDRCRIIPVHECDSRDQVLFQVAVSAGAGNGLVTKGAFGPEFVAHWPQVLAIVATKPH